MTRERTARLGGVPLALLSALAFSLSGTLASPLLHSGWSPGSVVLIRVALGALLVLPFAASAMRGRWHLVVENLPMLLMYGVLAVGAAQFCYFSAVEHMQVAPALMIEYTSPAVVVLWMWWQHGQRPGRLTVLGAIVAAAGLMLVLDVFSAAHLSLAGVLWALAAMAGGAVYFVISDDDGDGLPPIALAGGGLLIGAVVLALLGGIGALPLTASTTDVSYAGVDVAWWIPLVALGLVTAALAYVLGIAAVRALGSRLSSFVALSEVVAAVVWAWVLLGELPRLVQLVGGLLILVGVVGVKLGEPGNGIGVDPELDGLLSAGPAA